MKHLFPTMKGPETRNEAYTPKWIFDALGLTFDLDVAAPETDTFVPALQKYTRKDDGLAQPWHGLVWMNPPYSNPLPWVERFIEHGNGIALVPSSMGRWMKLLWEAETHWCMIPNVRFMLGSIDVEAKAAFPQRLYLVGMGRISYQALKLSNLGRLR